MKMKIKVEIPRERNPYVAAALFRNGGRHDGPKKKFDGAKNRSSANYVFQRF